MTHARAACGSWPPPAPFILTGRHLRTENATAHQSVICIPRDGGLTVYDGLRSVDPAQSWRTAPSQSKALSSENAPCLALITSSLMSASVMGARPPSMIKGCEYTGVKSAACSVD